MRTGFVDLAEAVERDRVAPPVADELRPRVRRPPRRLPEMPMPEGWERPPLAEPPADFAPPLDLPLAPPLTSGFIALPDSNGAIPPDTHGAVGPTKAMTTLNTQVLVQNRDGTTFSGPASLVSFWSGISSAGVFDPRVHYDPDPNYGGRWIWVACQGAQQNSSGILVAASAGSEPLRGPGGLFDADTGNAVWADYPSVGFNRHWVVVQINMFSMTNPYPFVRSEVYVFRKSELYAGTLAPIVFVLGPTSCEGSSCGGTQVPALTYDFTTDDLYLLQRWNSGAAALRLYRISGPAPSPTLTPLLPLVIGPTAWRDSEPTGTGADFAPQGPSCGGRKIQTNDSRIQNLVFRNGRLWATHTVFLPAATPNRASVQWWQIRTDSSIVQRGLVDDSSAVRFFAFPSIAVNKNDDVLLGFSSFEGSEPASARYAFRLATDPLGAMQVPSVLKAGEACYYKDFGTSRNRWGDYSATVVDPTDDTKLWTLQEYAATPNILPPYDRWGTWWGMLDPTPAIAITDPVVVEGDAGTADLVFDVSLSLATSQTVTVSWTTQNGTATVADSDYVAASGTVTFTPGDVAETIVVAVRGDVKREANETLRVNLSTPVNATLPDTQADGTILDDDPDPQISIGDRRVVEGSPTGTTLATFLLTLSNPSAFPVSVTPSTVAGTATAGTDFTPLPGTAVTFNPGEVAKNVVVSVVKDAMSEPDETYFVNLSAPSGGAILKGTGNGVIIDDDSGPAYPGVWGLSVVSDGGVSTGRNRLQWVNPVTTTAVGIRIRRNSATLPSTCSAPATAGDGSGVSDEPWGGSGAVQSFEHTGLNNGDVYCYSVFVEYPSSTFSGRAEAQGRPFDSTAGSGRVRWKYFTGLAATTVAPPTVGTDGVVVPSNDNLVHGMQRGATGGPWPTPPQWMPANLGSPAQARSPIVPLAGGSRVFLSTQDGWVHALDAKTGAKIWETRIGTAAGAAPAGIFTAFGGAWDYVLVGTAEADNNRFYALDPGTGAVIDYFPKVGDPESGLGAVLGMAAVDYARSQVYFGTFGGSSQYTLWGLKLGPPSDALQWASWSVPRSAIGDIDGSPVVRGDRVYVGTVPGLLWSVHATTATDRYSHTPTGAPEAIRGFPFPDRGSTALYFKTTSRIHAATDGGPGNFVQKWNPVGSLTSPSPVLFWAAQNRLYVGVGSPGARILSINAADGSQSTPIVLETTPNIAVGAPSLDVGSTPVMLHAGSVQGVIYAVQVP